MSLILFRHLTMLTMSLHEVLVARMVWMLGIHVGTCMMHARIHGVHCTVHAIIQGHMRIRIVVHILFRVVEFGVEQSH